MILIEYTGLDVVITVELELKRMNIRHSFIIKNPWRWAMLVLVGQKSTEIDNNMEYTEFDIVITMELKMSIRHSFTVLSKIRRDGRC